MNKYVRDAERAAEAKWQRLSQLKIDLLIEQHKKEKQLEIDKRKLELENMNLKKEVRKKANTIARLKRDIRKEIDRLLNSRLIVAIGLRHPRVSVHRKQELTQRDVELKIQIEGTRCNCVCTLILLTTLFYTHSFALRTALQQKLE